MVLSAHNIANNLDCTLYFNILTAYLRTWNKFKSLHLAELISLNMDRMIDDFFIPDNEVRLQEELDYSRVSEYIRSAEAFSRSTYQSVYIIDYFRQNFLYVSPNPMLLCGLSPEQMRDLGYRFYIQSVSYTHLTLPTKLEV